jgi:hypothetical protein
MSTHGDILVKNKGDRRSKGIWLHAYSDGHTENAFDLVTTLPEWFIYRALLAYSLDDISLGKKHLLKNFKEDSWDIYWDSYSVNFGAHKCTISGLICNRFFDRWVPLPESEVPWHKVGESPDLTIICNDSTYDVISGAEKTTVEWMDRLYEGFRLAGELLPMISPVAKQVETSYDFKQFLVLLKQKNQK